MRVSVEKAASYSPHDIAAPMITQLVIRETGPLATARLVKPTAKSKLDADRTQWPPWRSMRRPENGAHEPEMSRPTEKAANTHSVGMPRSEAIALARTAGR